MLRSIKSSRSRKFGSRKGSGRKSIHAIAFSGGASFGARRGGVPAGDKRPGQPLLVRKTRDSLMLLVGTLS